MLKRLLLGQRKRDEDEAQEAISKTQKEDGKLQQNDVIMDLTQPFLSPAKELHNVSQTKRIECKSESYDESDTDTEEDSESETSDDSSDCSLEDSFEKHGKIQEIWKGFEMAGNHEAKNKLQSMHGEDCNTQEGIFVGKESSPLDIGEVKEDVETQGNIWVEEFKVGETDVSKARHDGNNNGVETNEIPETATWEDKRRFIKGLGADDTQQSNEHKDMFNKYENSNVTSSIRSRDGTNSQSNSNSNNNDNNIIYNDNKNHNNYNSNDNINCNNDNNNNNNNNDDDDNTNTNTNSSGSNNNNNNNNNNKNNNKVQAHASKSNSHENKETTNTNRHKTKPNPSTQSAVNPKPKAHAIQQGRKDSPRISRHHSFSHTEQTTTGVAKNHREKPQISNQTRDFSNKVEKKELRSNLVGKNHKINRKGNKTESKKAADRKNGGSNARFMENKKYVNDFQTDVFIGTLERVLGMSFTELQEVAQKVQEEKKQERREVAQKVQEEKKQERRESRRVKDSGGNSGSAKAIEEMPRQDSNSIVQSGKKTGQTNFGGIQLTDQRRSPDGCHNVGRDIEKRFDAGKDEISSDSGVSETDAHSSQSQLYGSLKKINKQKQNLKKELEDLDARMLVMAEHKKDVQFVHDLFDLYNDSLKEVERNNVGVPCVIGLKVILARQLREISDAEFQEKMKGLQNFKIPYFREIYRHVEKLRGKIRESLEDDRKCRSKGVQMLRFEIGKIRGMCEGLLDCVYQE